MGRKVLMVMVAAVCFILIAPSGGETVGANIPQEDEARAREPAERGPVTLGTITSVGVDRFEMKQPDGSLQTILVNEHTRFRQGDQEIQLEDLKPGEQVVARCEPTEPKQFVALSVRRITEEERMRFQAFGDRVFGEIVSIEKDRLKLRQRRQGETVVLISNETVFVKEGQPITLEDLQIGDRVIAFGQVSEGKFVARRVAMGRFGLPGRQPREEK